MTGVGNNHAAREGAVPLISKDFYTVDEGLSFVGYGRFQYMMLVFCGMALFADSMEMMILAFLAPALRCEWDLTARQESWISSVVFLGYMFGAYVWGALSDMKGRKVGFFMTAAFTGIVGLISALSPSYAFLLVCRGFVGFGLGGVPVAASMYAEYIPKDLRGVCLVFIELFWTMGSITTAAIAWLVMGKLGLSWRVLLAIAAIPFALLLLIFPFLPESPHFLAVKGRTRAAENVLQKIAKFNGRDFPANFRLSPAHSTTVAKIPWYSELGRQMQRMFAPSMALITVLASIGWFVATFGYYAVVLLTTEIHTGDGGNSSCLGDKLNFTHDNYQSILIASLGSFFSYPLDMLAVDTIGRKWSISGAYFLAGASLVPFLFTMKWSTVPLFLARMFGNSGFVMIFVYTPEIYPTEVRTYAMGFVNVWARIGGMIAPIGAQEIFHDFGLQITIIGFIVVYLIGALAAALLPMDTKGRPLADVIEEEKGTPVVEDVESVQPGTGNAENPNHRNNDNGVESAPLLS